MAGIQTRDMMRLMSKTYHHRSRHRLADRLVENVSRHNWCEPCVPTQLKISTRQGTFQHLLSVYHSESSDSHSILQSYSHPLRRLTMAGMIASRGLASSAVVSKINSSSGRNNLRSGVAEELETSC